jgi:hypothetical protein
MLNPFEPAKPWTEAKHRQWAADREAGTWRYAWHGTLLAFRQWWAIAIILLSAAFYIGSLWPTFRDGLDAEELRHLFDHGHGLLFAMGSFLLMIVLTGAGTALERWAENEQLYHFYLAPPTHVVAVAGLNTTRFYALTNTVDFAETYTAQLLSFADGVWTPIYTLRGGPRSLDLAILADGGLIITRADQTLVIVAANGVKHFATPGAAGFAVPLDGDQFLVVGNKEHSKHSARVNVLTEAVESLDLLVDIPPTVCAGRAYLCDHGRYQVAVVGGGQIDLIPHSPIWRICAMSVAPDGTIYLAVYPRSGGDAMIWHSNGAWQQCMDLPFRNVINLAHDGDTLLALSEHGISRLDRTRGEWITEFSGAGIEMFAWGIYRLDEQLVVLDVVTGSVSVRRDGVWESASPIPGDRA